MKLIVTILILISSLTSFSQTANVIGDYKRVIETNDNNTFEYQLTLSQDGTFLFHYYSKIKQGFPPEVNKYGKGKWTLENNVISFFCYKQRDIDKKNTKSIQSAKSNKTSGEAAENIAQRKVGRNDPCPCGSDKKFKHCHGALK